MLRLARVASSSSSRGGPLRAAFSRVAVPPRPLPLSLLPPPPPLVYCRALCTTSPTTAATADSSAAANLDTAVEEVAASFGPGYSRRHRRSRLEQALEACRRGEPFVLPKPEPLTMPGPVAAVKLILEEKGPLKFQQLYDIMEERYPGLARTRRFFKQNILHSALVHQLMKVRVDSGTDVSRFKDHWALRQPGQTRMRIARRLGMPRRGRGSKSATRHKNRLPQKRASA